MKRIIICFTIFAFASLNSIAQVIQQCVVKQYNKKNAKSPLSGVQVEVRNANTATSDANGRLSLSFPTLKPGDRVVFRTATKAGYELMNKNVVDQWYISRNNSIFELVMINSTLFSQLKQNIHQVAFDSYKKKYDEAMSELVRLEKAQKLKKEEYLRKMIELEDRYDEQLKNLDTYIDQFARIDLSELSQQEQRFVDLVYAGHLDEAASEYEKLDAASKYAAAIANVHRINEDITKLEEEKAAQQKAADTFFSILQRHVNTLKLAGGQDNFQKAAQLLRRAAIADTTNLYVVKEYAEFALLQLDYNEAERFYLICLNGSGDKQEEQAVYQANLGKLYNLVGNYSKAIYYLHQALENFTTLFKDNPNMHQVNFVKTHILIGSYYRNIKSKDKAEEFYSLALNYLLDFYHQNPDSYRTLLLQIQHDLGVLYTDFQNYTKAEDYFYQALENITILFNQSPDIYRVDLSGILNNMGNVYYKMHNYTKTEDYYLKALEIFTQLFKHNPDAYLAHLADILNNLGALYSDLNNYAKAEDYYLKALECRTQLFNQVPETYLPDLTGTQNNLGDLYSKMHEYTKAEKYYLQALEGANALSKQYPEIYRDILGDIQNNLGFLYSEIHNYSKAETYLLHALENRTTLYERDTDAYRADLADTQNNLAIMYDECQNISKAEEYYLKALENKRLLFKQNSEAYRYDMATTLHNLGTFYSNFNYEKAKEYYLQSLMNKKLLVRQDSNAFRPTIAYTLSNLGDLYYQTKDYSMAENYIKQSIDHFTKASKQNPDAYRSSIERLRRNLDLVHNSTSSYTNATQSSQYKRIEALETNTWNMSFTAGCEACIYVSGNGNSNLDMFVYDEDGELIGSDEGISDECIYSFSPLISMKIKIKVENRGEKDNNYTISKTTW